MRISAVALTSSALLGVALLVAACASTRPAGPAEPRPEVLRLVSVLDSLRFAPLPARLAEGEPLWDELAWTTRKAVEAADVRRHFLVRGDEVDVLIYPNARVARYEGERVREGIGALPLAAAPAEGEAPLVATTYFVAGPVVVRQRGLDDTLRAALTAALGDPVGASGPSGYASIDYAPETSSLAYDPYDVGPLGAPLYQGREVPSWSVDPAAVNGPYGAAYRALYYGE